MTERGVRSLRQRPDELCIGPSSARWDGGTLEFRIDERASPWPFPARGIVRVIPTLQVDRHFDLDRDGRHRWFPIAPAARVEVRLDSPGLRWNGSGYCDSNTGDEPLEDRVKSWHWSRCNLPGASLVLYDVEEQSGQERTLALRFANDGRVEELASPPKVNLARSGWRLSRMTRSDGGASIEQTLEDTPFYVRSVLNTQLFGHKTSGIHESLYLDRFRSPLVQAMLRFRMRRSADSKTPG